MNSPLVRVLPQSGNPSLRLARIAGRGFGSAVLSLPVLALAQVAGPKPAQEDTVQLSRFGVAVTMEGLPWR
jgi:hypothetical protein